MYLAIPKEDINNESRVAATPGTVKELISAGLDVYVETEAGSKSYISDKEYEEAGANIIVSGSTIFKENKGDLKKNIELNIEEAIQAVVPVVPSTEERHKPPPKIIKIPHPIFFSSSFHEINPRAGASAVIKIAII